MPTIQFQLADLCTLVGQKIKIEDLDDLAMHGKAELEGYDKKTDTVTLSCEDTNQPYLWSVEGFARLLRGVLGKEKGIPILSVHKSTDKVIVNKNIGKSRPYIALFRASGKKVDDYLLKQMIQLQEKFCDTYGRRRRKASIGIYRYKDIVFPLHYTLADPAKTSFIPLGYDNILNLFEILEQHPAGKKYAYTLENMKKFPILHDDTGKVLSLIPIINSADPGQVEVGDDDLLIEVTGTDLETVHLGLNILAYAFYDRGYALHSIDIAYPTKKITTPYSFNDKIRISLDKTNSLLGFPVSKTQFKQLLEKMRYTVKDNTVFIPDYRKDIMHQVDVIEDVGIMYGYEDIPTLPLASYTSGRGDPLIHFVDKCRELLVGFGFQEIISAVLSNKELLYDKMNIKDFGTVEIKDYMSQSYSALRTWLVPLLLQTLSKNKHHDYPQLIFEQGLVSVRKKGIIIDYERLAAAMAGPEVDYTRIRQILDALLNAFAIEYTLKEVEHGSFIPGRAVRVSVKGKDIAFIGEIHPQVLEHFDIQMPVAALEINLTELFSLIKKK